jgi:hypothetical protein
MEWTGFAGRGARGRRHTGASGWFDRTSVLAAVEAKPAAPVPAERGQPRLAGEPAPARPAFKRAARAVAGFPDAGCVEALSVGSMFERVRVKPEEVETF